MIKKLKGFGLSNQNVKCFKANPKQQLNISPNVSRVYDVYTGAIAQLKIWQSPERAIIFQQ